MNHSEGAGLTYSSVHKRSMDGTCAKTINDFTKPSDFTSGELPMDRVEWTGNLMKNHPLCDMPADFVNTTLTMHHKESPQHKMFISFDGRGDVTALRSMGAVFSTVIDDASDTGKPTTTYQISPHITLIYCYCHCHCYFYSINELTDLIYLPVGLMYLQANTPPGSLRGSTGCMSPPPVTPPSQIPAQPATPRHHYHQSVLHSPTSLWIKSYSICSYPSMGTFICSIL